MAEIIQVFFALGILISIAKVAGFIATRFGQPAVLAGVLSGHSLLNWLHIAVLFPDATSVEHTMIEFAEIDVLFLMIAAGLEVI